MCLTDSASVTRSLMDLQLYHRNVAVPLVDQRGPSMLQFKIQIISFTRLVMLVIQRGVTFPARNVIDFLQSQSVNHVLALQVVPLKEGYLLRIKFAAIKQNGKFQGRFGLNFSVFHSPPLYECMRETRKRARRPHGGSRSCFVCEPATFGRLQTDTLQTSD